VTRNIVKNKRALSPVIATVILVSVTIVVAVSVAYWMGTIAGGYTAYEQIELPTSYAEYDDDYFTGGGWNVTIELKNTGSADATIDNIFLNTKPIKSYPAGTVELWADGTNVTDLTAIGIPIQRGGSIQLLLLVQKYDSAGPSGVEGCTAGTRIDLKIHSAAGQEYPVQVRLP
jgi:flagellin-like protein